MNKQTEALKLALEFIEANTYGGDDVAQLMTSIREALAEQPTQQEPVCDDDICVDCGMEYCECGEKDD